MPTLTLLIDATKAKQGADQWEQANKQVQNTGKATKQTLHDTTEEMKHQHSVAGQLTHQVQHLAAAFGLMLAAHEVIHHLVETDKAMKGLQASAGLSAKGLIEFSEAASRTSVSTQWSSAQAAQTMMGLVRAGHSAEGALETYQSVMDLAAAKTLDLASAVHVVDSAMDAFRLQESETAHVTDVLAAVSTAAGVEVLKIGDAMRTTKGVTAIVKVSLEETAAAIGALAMRGIEGSTAGMGLKEMLSNLVYPTQAQEQAMRQMGITTKEMVNPAVVGLYNVLKNLKGVAGNLNLAEQIVGPRAAPVLINLVESLTEYKDILDQVGQSQGLASQQAATATDTIEGAMLRFKNVAAAAVEHLLGGNGLFDAIKKVLNVASNGILIAVGLGDQVKSLTTASIALGVALRMVAVYAGTLMALKLLAELKQLVSWFLFWASALKTARDALAALKLLWETSSIGIAIAGVSALVSGFMLLTDHVNDSKEAVKDFGKELDKLAGYSQDYANAQKLYTHAVGSGNVEDQREALMRQQSILKSMREELLTTGKVNADNWRAVFGTTFGQEALKTIDKMRANVVDIDAMRSRWSGAGTTSVPSGLDLDMTPLTGKKPASDPFSWFKGPLEQSSRGNIGYVEALDEKLIGLATTLSGLGKVAEPVFSPDTRKLDAFLASMQQEIDLTKTFGSNMDYVSSQRDRNRFIIEQQSAAEQTYQKDMEGANAYVLRAVSLYDALAEARDTANRRAMEAEAYDQLSSMRQEIDLLQKYGDNLDKVNDALSRSKFMHEQESKALKIYGTDVVAVLQYLTDAGKIYDALTDARNASKKPSRNENLMAENYQKLVDFRDSIAQETTLIGLFGQEAEARRQILQLEKLAKDAAVETSDTEIAATKKQLETLNRLRQMREIADGIGQAFGDAFGQMILGAKSAKQAVEDLTKAIAELVIRQAVAQPIASMISTWSMSLMRMFMPAYSGPNNVGGSGGLPSYGGPSNFPVAAQGALVNNGNMIKFAMGGLAGMINDAFIFPLRGGKVGMAGEAGPEYAASPVRMPDGNLGVRVAGGGNTYINMNIQTRDADSFRRSGKQIRSMLRGATN